MPLVDLDDPVELRARWAALAAVAHAAGRDRVWWADERGMHYEDPRGNDLRLIIIADGRAVLFGHHDEESRTATGGTYADLLTGAPDWIGQPEVRHRMATGGLGFVYGHFAGTWARAEYPGDPWQPVDDGFLALGSWLTDDREAEYEIAEQVLSWAGAIQADIGEIRFGAMKLIRAAATSGLDARVVGEFFTLLRGAQTRLRPDGGPVDPAAGVRAAVLFGGPTAARAEAAAQQAPAAQPGPPAPAQVHQQAPQARSSSPFMGQAPVMPPSSPFVGASPFAPPSSQPAPQPPREEPAFEEAAFEEPAFEEAAFEEQGYVELPADDDGYEESDESDESGFFDLFEPLDEDEEDDEDAAEYVQQVEPEPEPEPALEPALEPVRRPEPEPEPEAELELELEETAEFDPFADDSEDVADLGHNGIAENDAGDSLGHGFGGPSPFARDIVDNDGALDSEPVAPVQPMQPVQPVGPYGVVADPKLWALPSPDDDDRPSDVREPIEEPEWPDGGDVGEVVTAADGVGAELAVVPDLPEDDGGDGPDAEADADGEPSYETLEDAMRAEPERPRPRPEPGPAFTNLHEWCRERTRVVPSGFTIHVYVANPQAIGYSFDLEPPEVADSHIPADRIGSLLHALWQEETDPEHGAWMFARIDAAGRTMRVDRWYDSVPSWWEGPIADRPIDGADVGWHLEHRSGDWQPSYANRTELAAG